MTEKQIPDLSGKLRYYTDLFGSTDEELYIQEIPNNGAYRWLLDEVPLLDCPDEELEKTYYFRWWTLRKHWKNTPYGHVMTEFLPPVSWAGSCNTINCAAGHHIREARWMRDENGWIKDYIRFWLEGHGDAFSYSMWFADSVKEYLAVHPDDEFMESCLPGLDALYQEWERRNLHSSGLFWSDDDRDGMEYSISGSGLRPTFNSYMYGDALAIADMAERLNHEELAASYRERAESLKILVDRLLWDGDFYRTIPCRKDDEFSNGSRPKTEEAHYVRELLGYIPWYFHLPDSDKDGAFAQLLDAEGFKGPYGPTTAEQRHPRFLYSAAHECLWNGYVWAYATSQTLTAIANVIRDRRRETGKEGSLSITEKDFYCLLRQYALSQRRTDETGRTLCWIDEAMHPYTGKWSAREILLNGGWDPSMGGKERGKDYNHSTFCDLVLSSLFGITRNADGTLSADPFIPNSWDYFLVTNLPSGRAVLYDRDGSRYGHGAGLHIL